MHGCSFSSAVGRRAALGFAFHFRSQEHFQMVGKIKFYSPEKRYGFIRGADGVDIFFGEDQLTSGFEVEKDLPVEFVIKVDPTNWKQYVENVRCLNASEARTAD